jgi:hypothetical protein
MSDRWVLELAVYPLLLLISPHPGMRQTSVPSFFACFKMDCPGFSMARSGRIPPQAPSLHACSICCRCSRVCSRQHGTGLTALLQYLVKALRLENMVIPQIGEVALERSASAAASHAKDLHQNPRPHAPIAHAPPPLRRANPPLPPVYVSPSPLTAPPLPPKPPPSPFP